MQAVIRIVEETLKNKDLQTVAGKACSKINMELQIGTSDIETRCAFLLLQNIVYLCLITVYSIRMGFFKRLLRSNACTFDELCADKYFCESINEMT